MDNFKIIQFNGAFVKEEGTVEEIKENKYYPFSLHMQKNINKYYADTNDDRESWLKLIRKVIGYSCFFNFYSIGVLLYLL